MPGYSPRIVDEELDELLVGLPAIAIEGAKGTGKTATGRRRALTVVELDDPVQRALASADLRELLERPRPLLIDEWQRLPDVWDAVRRAVDADTTTPAQFLLTGSAAPGNISTHSGAGRIVRLRMRPLSLAERGIETPAVSVRELLSGTRPEIKGATAVRLSAYVDEILRSGFPGVRGLTNRALRAQLDAYVSRIVDRDFDELGHKIRQPALLLRWLRAYASATATTAAYETIRDAATGGESDKPTKLTTLRYREILERLWILDAVPAWLPSRNPLTSLTQSPKHHLVDPALSAQLLGVSAESLLQGETERSSAARVPTDGVLLGALFESLVTQSVRIYAQANEARVGHLRLAGGRHEIDLIVERADRRVLALEVKLSATVSDDDVRHLHWLRNAIGDDLLDAVVVTIGPDAYRRADGIAVIPAALLGP